MKRYVMFYKNNYDYRYESEIIAYYPTKERCLEVLDEIEQATKEVLMIPAYASLISKGYDLMNGENNTEISMAIKEVLRDLDVSVVYQMPEV